MRAFSIENGRVTGTRQLGRALVKNKIVHAITASNHWASTETSSGYAWFVYFGSGDFNFYGKFYSTLCGQWQHFLWNTQRGGLRLSMTVVAGSG